MTLFRLALPAAVIVALAGCGATPSTDVTGPTPAPIDVGVPFASTVPTTEPPAPTPQPTFSVQPVVTPSATITTSPVVPSTTTDNLLDCHGQFLAMDTNHDGALEPEEWAAGHPNDGNAAQSFATWDADHSGAIDPDEYGCPNTPVATPSTF